MLASAPALAAPCAGIVGDAALVDEVGAQLAARGVACGRVRATVERDGTAIVVRDDQPVPTVRRVGDATTAATVIESWTGVEDDLLASRPVVAPVAVERAEAAPVAPTLRGWQVFGAAQTAVANDRTKWLGFEGGACVMVGPICAAARLRTATVEAGPEWVHTMSRRSTELLIGGDVPFKVGSWMFAPGFGGGIGSMKTHVSGDDTKVGGVTGGLRAEVHAALVVPIAAKLSVDLSAAVELTQATHEETWMPMGQAPVVVPDEPEVLVRLAIGLRWGQI